MTEQEKYGMEQLAEYLDMRIRNEEKNYCCPLKLKRA